MVRIREIGRSSNPHSLLNYRRENSRVDLYKSFANVSRTRNRTYDLENANKAYVPVFVMLPLGIINMECELVDPDGLRNQLIKLKSVGVNGVVHVETWWGIVEANNPQQYNWEGYKHLFKILRDLDFKLQVVMAFHECGGNVGDDDVHIPLPKWVQEIGKKNPDIYFTDRNGIRNTETLTWGIDEEPVLRGRTAVQVYKEYMRSFQVEFDKFFRDGTIAQIEIGLGAYGVLRYPSHPAKIGWERPDIGEFQCYDKYLRKGLEKAADAKEQPSWGKPPEDTKVFFDDGDCNSKYRRFFLKWYSRYLVDHGDRVLAVANGVFGNCLSLKLSGMHWWYDTASHAAAELTAGFYDRGDDRDGSFAPIVNIINKYDTALNFTWRTLDKQEGDLEAMVGPVWQVVKAAFGERIPISCENALPCYDTQGYNQILALAKPRNEPSGRHFYAFIYRRLNQALLEKDNFTKFELFVKRMHGEDKEYEDEVDTFAEKAMMEMKKPKL